MSSQYSTKAGAMAALMVLCIAVTTVTAVSKPILTEKGKVSTGEYQYYVLDATQVEATGIYISLYQESGALALYVCTKLSLDPESDAIVHANNFLTSTNSVSINPVKPILYYVYVRGCKNKLNNKCCSRTSFKLEAITYTLTPPKSVDIDLVDTKPNELTITWPSTPKTDNYYVAVYKGASTAKGAIEPNFYKSQLATSTPPKSATRVSSGTLQYTFTDLEEFTNYDIRVWASVGSDYVPYRLRGGYTFWTNAAAFPADYPPADGSESALMMAGCLVGAFFLPFLLYVCCGRRAISSSWWSRDSAYLMCGVGEYDMSDSGESMVATAMVLGLSALWFLPFFMGTYYGIVRPQYTIAETTAETVCQVLDIYSYECQCSTDQYGHTTCSTCTEVTVNYAPGGVSKPQIIKYTGDAPSECGSYICRYKKSNLDKVQFKWHANRGWVIALSILATILPGYMCAELMYPCLAGGCACLKGSGSGRRGNYDTLISSPNDYSHGGSNNDSIINITSPTPISQQPAKAAGSSSTVVAGPYTPATPEYVDNPPTYGAATITAGTRSFAGGKKVVLFGPPGVGKSTIITLAQSAGFTAVDLDEMETSYEGRKRVANELVFRKTWPQGILVCAADLRVEDIPSSYMTIMLLPPKKTYLARVKERNIYRPHKGGQSESSLYDLFKMSRARFTVTIATVCTAEKMLSNIEATASKQRYFN